MASGRKQVCVIVAGMHRSGTSALTRVLSLLGCALPSTLLAANPTNESGHWEPQRIQEFNDRLLQSAGCSWDDWTPVPQDWFDSLEAGARREEAADLFRAEYGSAPLTVFKDPRVCRLLPFWLAVLDDLDIEAVVAIPVRHPLEVARSLAVRDLSDPHHNRLLWLRHVTDAERYSRGRARYFCSYDDLLESWSAVLSRMGDALSVKWPRMSAQAVEEIDAYLKPQLRHHRLNARLLDDDRTEPEWLKTTYSVVARWAAHGEDADGKVELDRISFAMNEAGASFGMLALRGKVAMAKVRQSEADFASVQEERDALASRCDALALALGEAQGEIASLRDLEAASTVRADELATALVETGARADAAKSEALSLLAALAEANARADAGRSEAEEWNSAMADANARFDAMRAEAEALSSALAEANSRADAARAEADALVEALREANTRADAGRTEVDALMMALAEANANAATAGAEVETMAAALETATARADGAEAVAEAARLEMTNNVDALTRANEASVVQLSQFEAVLQVKDVELARLASALSEERAALEAVRGLLARDGSASGDVHEQIVSLVARLQEAEGQLEGQATAIDSMQLVLDGSDARVAQLVGELDQKDHLVTALKSNIDMLLVDLQDRDRSSEALLAAEGELSALAERLTLRDDQLVQLQAEKDESEKVLLGLKSNIALLLEDLRERDLIRSELLAAERQLSTLTQRLADMEAELGSSTSALRQKSAEADDAYGELERIKDVLQTETNEKARLQRAAEGLRANVSLLMSDLNERDARVAQIQSEAERFRITVQASQEKINKLLVDSQITLENLVRGIVLEPNSLFQSRRGALKKKAALLRDAGVVDVEWYRSSYPELKDIGGDPVEHFITDGYLDGRRPKLPNG